MQPIVKLDNLSVIYDLGKSNENWALRDATAEIYPGEYIIFFGPSGCGKSTLLYTIAGLEFPTKGKVIVYGKNLKALNRNQLINFHRSTIGMIFQAYYLLPTLNIKDNILLPQIFAKRPVLRRNKKVKSLMEKFGIWELRKRKPFQLSGGQQQRAATARALINNPSIILADEPVGNLDSKNAKIVLDLLEKINRDDKKTIIHVTHNPRDLPRADRVFYIEDGEIVRETTNFKKLSRNELLERKASEIQRLAQAYPYLTESRLTAKLIFYHLLLPFGVETQEKIEETIDKYLLGKIGPKELFEILNNPPEKEGANLYSQRAEALSRKIFKLAKEIKITKNERFPTPTLAQARAAKLRAYLLDSYHGRQLSFEQIERLDEFLSQRIRGRIGKKELERLFNIPLQQNGVGLNRRTAKRFVRELELILMKQ